MVDGKVKKSLTKKTKKHAVQLDIFDKMSVFNLEQESTNNTYSEEIGNCKIGKGELFNINCNQSSEKFKQHIKSFLNLDDCITADHNYRSLHSCITSHINSNK